ncbi:MAG: nitroreductase family protein [Actinobacteria bacterium]|nr:nitroreductase family protein [Actinomycetota bacterium]
MDVFEAMEKRRSVRSFRADREVADELVEELLRCACQAPSAGNVQPWRFVVVRDAGLKERLAKAALGQSFVAEAPVVIVVCADLAAHAAAYGRRGVELYAVQDTAAATQNMLLCATALGLGACWVGAFREEEVARELRLARDIRPLALVPVGYAAREEAQPRKMDCMRLTTYL